MHAVPLNSMARGTAFQVLIVSQRCKSAAAPKHPRRAITPTLNSIHVKSNAVSNVGSQPKAQPIETGVMALTLLTTSEHWFECHDVSTTKRSASSGQPPRPGQGRHLGTLLLRLPTDGQDQN